MAPTARRAQADADRRPADGDVRHARDRAGVRYSDERRRRAAARSSGSPRRLVQHRRGRRRRPSRQPSRFRHAAHRRWVFGRFASPTPAGAPPRPERSPRDGSASARPISTGSALSTAARSGSWPTTRWPRPAAGSSASTKSRSPATPGSSGTCSAPARLTLTGIFTSIVTGKMNYYPLDGPEGQMIVKLLKQSMKKGVTGGMPAMPSIPGVSP